MLPSVLLLMGAGRGSSARAERSLLTSLTAPQLHLRLHPQAAFLPANFPLCDPRRPLNCRPPSGPPLMMSSLSVTIHQAATIQQHRKPHLFLGAFQQEPPTHPPPTTASNRQTVPQVSSLQAHGRLKTECPRTWLGEQDNSVTGWGPCWSNCRPPRSWSRPTLVRSKG